MLQEVRMPLVRFYREAVARRDADGHTIYVDVDFCEVTAAGGRDSNIKVVHEWLKDLLEKSTTRNAFDAGAEHYRAWHDKIKNGYEAWKQGQEPPVDGTAISSIKAFTPAETKNCEAAGYRSLEDLAAANEEGLARIGPGGRALKQKAEAILKANVNNAVAEENTALKVRMAELEAKVQAMIEAGVKEPKLKKAA